jgi:hypothetical protein
MVGTTGSKVRPREKQSFGFLFLVSPLQSILTSGWDGCLAVPSNQGAPAEEHWRCLQDGHLVSRRDHCTVFLETRLLNESRPSHVIRFKGYPEGDKRDPEAYIEAINNLPKGSAVISES